MRDEGLKPTKIRERADARGWDGREMQRQLDDLAVFFFSFALTGRFLFMLFTSQSVPAHILLVGGRNIRKVITLTRAGPLLRADHFGRGGGSFLRPLPRLTRLLIVVARSGKKRSMAPRKS